MPRIAFINKMDRVGADFAAAVQSMVDRLGARAVPIQLPIGAEDGFEGIIDLVERKAIRYTDSIGDTWEEGEIPAELAGAAAEAARHDLIEAVADHDEDIAMAFLEDEEIDAARLRAAIRACTLDLSITPVLCGSAFKNKGVQPLLDAIIDYLPTPLDKGAVTGIDPKTGEEVERKPSLDEPFCALAFKIMSDPFVGKLTYFRVYSGVLKAGSHVYNPRRRAARSASAASSRCTPTAARSASRSAPARSPPPSASSRSRPATRSATRRTRSCSSRSRSRSPSSGWPSSPRRRPTRTSSPRRSRRLSEEDPTFRVRTDDETGQVVISGMGELHLEIIVDRLVREFSVGGQRRQAAGRLPRDHPQARSRRCRASSCARPAAAASTATRSSRSSRTPARATSSTTRSPAA